MLYSLLPVFVWHWIYLFKKQQSAVFLYELITKQLHKSLTSLIYSSLDTVPATWHAITSYSQNYVIKHDAASGLALLDRCSSGTPLDVPFSGSSGIRCAAACSLRSGCYSFNFIQPPGQPGEGRCELMGVDSGAMNYEEGCKYFVKD